MSDTTPQQRMGRTLVLASISSLLLLDIGIKMLMLIAGTLRAGQIFGSIVTVLLCWFLWRGSKFAYWFLLCCVVLGDAYLFTAAGTPLRIVLFVWSLIFSIPLLLPATRSFMSAQRLRHA